MFELIEEALDEITFAIEREIAVALGLPVGFGRNDGSDSAVVEGRDEGIGIVGLVGNQSLWLGVVDQWLGASEIVSLAWGEHQLDGVAQRIDERVDLGGQSAARSADRLRTVFFRAPAEC